MLSALLFIKSIIFNEMNGECGSYNAVAKMHGVTRQTVKNVVTSNPENGQKLQQKKTVQKILGDFLELDMTQNRTLEPC